MWNVVSESYPFSSNSICPKSFDLSEIRSDQVQATKKQNPLKKGQDSGRCNQDENHIKNTFNVLKHEVMNV
jgi:hypothetical protein